MASINITPATQQIAKSGGLYIERETVILPDDDGGEQEIDSVVIGEESSDFFVAYLVGKEGLSLYTYPAYIADMPRIITTSIELRTLIARLVKELIKAS